MNAAEITDIHVDIIRELLSKLKGSRDNVCITYDELSYRLDRRVGPRNLANFLGDISEWCNQIEAPMLSVLVINKHDNKPGHGFFQLYRDLYGRKVGKEEEDIIFITELKKVLEYEYWNQFEKLF